MKQEYTAAVTEQYKIATKNRTVRYTIEENFIRYPGIREEFIKWYASQETLIRPTFANIFHPNFPQPMFDIRDGDIREDCGQRNALSEAGRQKKILGMAKNFDPKMFEPISVDCILERDGTYTYIIRDGAGRAHAAYLHGIYNVPVTVRYVVSYEESRLLFNAQDKFSASISSYDKYLQQLADALHSYHNRACDTLNISTSAGISLHQADASPATPLVDGIGLLQRTIKAVGGDAKNVKWGEKTAPNVIVAVSIIKNAFPNNDEIPASVLEAVTAYIYMSKNRIPSGDEGIRRLKKFIVDIRDSGDVELQDIKNWTKTLGFDSSNNYATYGASVLMEIWNELYKFSNRGRNKRSTYKWVSWEKFEIDIIKSAIIQLARDESLIPNG